jgi:hypothetical protein
MRDEKNDGKMRNEIEIKINQKTLLKGLGTSNNCLFAIKDRIPSNKISSYCFFHIFMTMKPFVINKLVII